MTQEDAKRVYDVLILLSTIAHEIGGIGEAGKELGAPEMFTGAVEKAKAKALKRLNLYTMATSWLRDDPKAASVAASVIRDVTARISTQLAVAAEGVAQTLEGKGE